jgi:hypothetical protein
MSRPRFDRTPLLFENYIFSRKYVVFRLLLKRSLKKTGRDDYFDERVQGKKALVREKNEKEKRETFAQPTVQRDYTFGLQD